LSEDALIWDRPRVVYHRVYFRTRRLLEDASPQEGIIGKGTHRAGVPSLKNHNLNAGAADPGSGGADQGPEGVERRPQAPAHGGGSGVVVSAVFIGRVERLVHVRLPIRLLHPHRVVHRADGRDRPPLVPGQNRRAGRRSRAHRAARRHFDAPRDAGRQGGEPRDPRVRRHRNRLRAGPFHWVISP